MFIFTDGESKTLERAPAPTQVTPSPPTIIPLPQPPPHIISTPCSQLTLSCFLAIKG